MKYYILVAIAAFNFGWGVYALTHSHTSGYFNVAVAVVALFFVFAD